TGRSPNRYQLPAVCVLCPVFRLPVVRLLLLRLRRRLRRLTRRLARRRRRRRRSRGLIERLPRHPRRAEVPLRPRLLLAVHLAVEVVVEEDLVENSGLVVLPVVGLAVAVPVAAHRLELLVGTVLLPDVRLVAEPAHPLDEELLPRLLVEVDAG